MLKRRSFLVYLLRSGFCLGLFAMAGCPGPSGQTDPLSSDAIKGIQTGSAIATKPPNEEALVTRMLQLVNQERTSRGLGEVTLNPVLSEMAAAYCTEMIEQGFFAHENPNTHETLGQRAISVGYIFLAIGENLAGGQTTPEQVVAEWMRSTQDRKSVV